MCNLFLFGHRLCTTRLIARAWMIYKIGIISKRYLIMFPQIQLIIVWSQVVHHFVLSKTEYGIFSTLVSSRAQDSRRDEARLFAPSRLRPRAA